MDGRNRIRSWSASSWGPAGILAEAIAPWLKRHAIVTDEFQETAVRPTKAFSASDIRRGMQHPDSHQRGRLSQICRMGVVVMLPIGSMHQQDRTSPSDWIWNVVSAEQRGLSWAWWLWVRMSRLLGSRK